MALSPINDNFDVKSSKPIDKRMYSSGSLTPFQSVVDANNTISSSYRYVGLSCFISSSTEPLTEYWYKSGIQNSDLVIKTTGGGSGSVSIPLTQIAYGTGTSITSSANLRFLDSNIYLSGSIYVSQSIVNPKIAGGYTKMVIINPDGTLNSQDIPPGISGSLNINNNALYRILAANGTTSSIEALPNFTYSGSVLQITGSVIITGSLSQGYNTTASNSSHAQGFNTFASGNYSHAQGQSTIASGSSAHAEGNSTYALGNSSHTEGINTIALSTGGHAEGFNTYVSGTYAHAEGLNTSASNNGAHAEGSSTKALGGNSHAEGTSTVVLSTGGHVEGNSGHIATAANWAHVEGWFTSGSAPYQHVQGAYNLPSDNPVAFIIGNGTFAGRSNLVYASGSIFQITGSVWISSLTGSGDRLVTVASDGLLKTGSLAISNLNDVLLTNLSNNQFLIYSGSQWVNINLPMVYYVSPSGSDSNNGLSPNKAWKTINKINSSSFSPGDSILFQGGASFTGYMQLTSSRHSGNVTASITIGSYGTGRAILVADNTPGILLNNTDYLNLVDLELKAINQPTGAVYNEGIYLQVSSGTNKTLTNINIDNVKAYGFSSNGVALYSYSETNGIENVNIKNSEFYNNRIGGITCYTNGAVGDKRTNRNINVYKVKTYNNPGDILTTYTNTGNGILLGGCVSSSIEWCEAYNNGYNNGWNAGGPIGIWFFLSDNCSIRYCESHHNRHGKSPAGYDGGGFDLDAGCSNCIVEYNYSHDNDGSGYLFYNYNSGYNSINNYIRYNISENDARSNGIGGQHAGIMIGSITGSTSNVYIHNNVVYCSSDMIRNGSTTYALGFISANNITNLNIFNNIFYIDGKIASMLYSTAGGNISNNIYYSVNGANLNFISGGIVTNPLLKEPGRGSTVGVYATGDLQSNLDSYKLRAGSPAINAGITASGYTFPTKDFFQNPLSGSVDIGIHEWLGSVSTNYIPQDFNNSNTIVTISGSITGSADTIYMCNTSASNINIHIIPSILYESGNTRKIVIKKISNDSNIINIIPTTGSCDGLISGSVTQFNESANVVSSGQNIFII